MKYLYEYTRARVCVYAGLNIPWNENIENRNHVNWKNSISASVFIFYKLQIVKRNFFTNKEIDFEN